jgi:hypothetical protein
MPNWRFVIIVFPAMNQKILSGNTHLLASTGSGGNFSDHIHPVCGATTLTYRAYHVSTQGKLGRYLAKSTVAIQSQSFKGTIPLWNTGLY